MQTHNIYRGPASNVSFSLVCYLINHHSSKCDFECETQDQLNTHISRIHIKDKHIKCRKCNYEAKTEKELSFHIADDHDIDIRQTGGQNKNNRTRRQTTEFCVFWNRKM